MIPVIALVGRPNVGKSTLFNRLTKSRDALVANLPGLTRDRQYGSADINGRTCLLVDTGGITGDEVGMDAEMARQSSLAMEEADAVLVILDARAGLTGIDQQLVSGLRGANKPVYYVVNKIDGSNPDLALAEFYELGAEQLFPITATHGRGVRKLMQVVLEAFPEPEAEQEQEEDDGRMRVAIVGRPNVGKSTLVNRILGEERVVVYDQPGTTRDSIYIDFDRGEQRYTLIDTAGVRRRKNIKETVEKFSIIKTLKAIADANVVILVMDASEGIVDQDLHLLGQVIDSGRAMVLAINKWDGLDEDHKRVVRTELDRRLAFIDYAETHFISALHGTNVGHLHAAVAKAYRSATKTLQTNRLTRILEDAVSDHQPPMVHGRRIKLRYAHAGGSNPPLIVIHGNQTDKVPSAYQRYLEKVFRRELDLQGTPVKVEFRTSDNPYAGRRNELTARQIARKRRLVQHVKKNAKKKRNR